mgnify:CR=1 FL=1
MSTFVIVNLVLKILIYFYNHGKVFRNLLITVLDHHLRLDQLKENQRAQHLLL